MSSLSDQILSNVTYFYLNSSRFNGIQLASLIDALSAPRQDCVAEISNLIRSHLISINCGDTHPNPHIKAFLPETPEVQLEKMAGATAMHCCIYPEPVHLKSVVDQEKYEGRPYTLRLALGEPQLKFVTFRLEVLEAYRNDPRYYYRHNDISGSICIKGDYFQGHDVSAADQILLETFGFAYDENLNRAVASFLWYLSCLSPEHQRIWNSKELGPEYKLHPDYYRSSIVGDFPEGISMFRAFLHEQRIINEIARSMKKPPLFKTQIDPDNKPREFSFLIRPTLKEFNSFVHLLDKLLSDNLEPSFFEPDVSRVEEVERSDGKVEVRKKGTLRLLEEWLDLRFHTPDPTPVQQMLASFRKVRKLRQKPAHRIDEDEFDQEYFNRQRELIIEAYSAINILRQILALHPDASCVKIPRYLEAKIWSY